MGLSKYKWLIQAVMHAPGWLKRRLFHNYRKHKHYYKVTGTVGDVKNMLMCALCPNMCRFDCPTCEASKSESGAPATRSRFAYYLEMGKFQGQSDALSEDAAKYTWLCADCDNCQVWCPMDISVGQLNYGLRADLVSKGISPPFARETAKVLEQHHNAYERVDFQKFQHDVPQAEVYYYIGCVTALNHPDVVGTNFKILEKAKISFTTAIQDRWCCGAPAWITGYRDLARRHAEHNARVVATIAPKVILFDCPECLHMWKTYYPELGAKIKPELLHTSEYFLRLLKEGRLKIKPHAEKELMTYHDPCVLSRKLEIVDPPRALLALLPNVDFKESFIRGHETHCCGFGGMLPYSWPQYAEAIGAKRLEELARTGASTIVTTCPSCETAFLKNDRDSQFEIRDLSQVLFAALE